MKLENIDISKLIPNFMRSADVLALADAVSDVLQPLARQIARLSTWDHLAELDTGELDDLAEELNIFWYDKTLTDDQKRTLIASSDRVYMKLGTAKAVEDVVSDIYGPSEVEEFFEYSGRPHYFRIRVQNPEQMTPENEAKLLRVLEKVKRKSQWLEGIQHEIALSIPLYVGMTVATHDNTSITFDTWLDHTNGRLYAGADLQTDQTGSDSPTILAS